MTTENAGQNKFPMTQALLDTVGGIFVEIAQSIPDEIFTKYRTAEALMDSAKNVGESEGMQPGDTLLSKDGSVGLQCKNKPGARFSQEEVYNLGEIGQTCIGLFNEAHRNDPREKQMAFTNKMALEISIKEITEFLKKMERCRQLAEEYRQSHPQPA